MYSVNKSYEIWYILRNIKKCIRKGKAATSNPYYLNAFFSKDINIVAV